MGMSDVNVHAINESEQSDTDMVDVEMGLGGGGDDVNALAGEAERDEHDGQDQAAVQGRPGGIRNRSQGRDHGGD